MTEQEQADLDQLKADIRKVKEECYYAMQEADRADARHIETSGYKGKSNAEFMRATFQWYKKRIEKLQAAYIRKYPD